jgi:uncharacterized membrane protein YkoI
MARTHLLAVATIVALGGAAGIAQAGDKPDAAEMAKLMAAKTSLTQAIAIAEKETGGKAIDADFDNENGALSLEIEVLKDKAVSKVIIDADTGKVVKIAVANSENDENDEND